MGYCARCYVAIRICEAESFEQKEILLVGLHIISLDTDKHVAFGFAMGMIVFISSS